MTMTFRLILLLCLTSFAQAQGRPNTVQRRPNILVAISDDQSFPHASAYGCKFVNTPAFDRVAEKGILFTNAYGASPGCSPCRAALLTGRHIWQIENAGTHASSFPAKYRTFPEVLAEHGYHTGYTGKGWGPGNYKVDGRTQNPAGPSFSSKKAKPPHSGMSNNDYAANFADFLSQRPAKLPFCFWYGASEPHRRFEKGSGLAEGKKLEDVEVPAFLPDSEEVRSDLLDYAVEIEHFDDHLGRMLDQLEEMGELDNTLVIVTSDNGMAFPRAKANCYEYGVHMPLAVCWGDLINGGHTNNDPIGFVELTAMIYLAGRVEPEFEYPLATEREQWGKALIELLERDSSSARALKEKTVYFGRERHSSSRYQNLAYPQRGMRKGDYLAIWNCRPERWPAGAPRKLEKNGELGPEHGGYHDIDACPTLDYLISHADSEEHGRFLYLATDPRDEFELFNVVEDPACLNNLAGKEGFEETEESLFASLQDYLVETEDPRALNGGDIFETYRRYSGLRSFPMPKHVEIYHEAMKEDGWIPLFNGRNLDGWKASTPKNSFEVINGMIKAQASANQSHLFYTGEVKDADFHDFEFMAEVMTTPGSNGGIYFHTSYQEEGFPNDGHEVQVNNSHKNQNKTGSLFSVENVTETTVEDNEIFELYVLVKGKTVQIRVDDETVVEYEEPADYKHPKYVDRNIDHGTFALQAHDPESTVYYRGIWVRPLDQE